MEETEASYHASVKVSQGDQFDNALIYGDNLLALKALEADYFGRVKCVFIDPPYNTFSAIPNYEDGVEHSLWLSLIRDRLEIIKNLISDDGSIWITIDDNESHYLKVLCDEIFGRSNFIGSVVWQHSVQGKNDAQHFSLHHNYIHVYRKTERFKRNDVPRTDEHNKNYANPDNDPNGAWRAGDVRSPNLRENLKYKVKTPSGRIIAPPEKGWRWSETAFYEKVRSGEITFLKDDTKVLRKIYLKDQGGRVPESIWFGNDVGTTREATNDLRKILPDVEELFPTPKPEKLIQRILQIATNEGDLVLDSFAGSGTTGAVAHKMGRRWIMVELGEHAVTHIVPRLKKVIDGRDQTGVTEANEWKGGGGFRFYRIAPSLLAKDRFGNWVISKEYDGEMLAAAVCQHLGFTYSPTQDSAEYWRHGHSTESDFIYVTTQSLTYEALKKLSEEVGPKRTLLVCCKAFNAKEDSFPNLTVKKIPHSILAKCEWGRDDYSLRIASLPQADLLEETEDALESNTNEPEAALPLFNNNMGGK
ncbi:site-specific DNA-methyltransferase [Agrobacterium pusense]|uniref:site-specific DNA-methyltransferase n=1 Tax=Agrobacterium pusense TaxID=648995 RepID=UPI000D19BEBF|nr:site-specific DNA-methyltransferase [Agrobacterium pusense]